MLVSSSSHLSRKEATEAFIEITGLDPSAPSLNEVKLKCFKFDYLAECLQSTVKTRV